jgi:hypothetical protein
MTFITIQQLDEAIDKWAAEQPLGALREGMAEYMTAYRLNACAVVEPLAALIYAGDLLTPERQAACFAAAEADGSLRNYVPDARAKERLASIRQMLNQLALAPPRAEAIEAPAPRRERAPRTQHGWVIACQVCGTEFRSRRADARCCSARCRQKASRAGRAASPGGAEPCPGTPVPRSWRPEPLAGVGAAALLGGAQLADQALDP